MPRYILTRPSGDYSSTFSATENPLSEGSRWIQGATTGLDWADISSASGYAHGNQTPDGGGDQNFNDSTALLTGTWGNDQTLEAVVVQTSNNTTALMEVELRLRSALTAHSCTGYEVYWSVQSTNKYLNIARWDGPLGSYTNIASTSTSVTVAHGDTLKATIIGTTITAYINGVQKLQYDTSGDGTKYASGKPGIGFFLGNTGGITGEDANYGWTSLTVTTV